MKEEAMVKKKTVQRKPLHSSLALDVLMRWTQMRDIATNKALREFLFRVAFIMDLHSVREATGENNFLAMYSYRKRRYKFTLDVLGKYIGYIATDETEDSLPRESFFKSLFLSSFKAMMTAGSYGIVVSMPKKYLSGSERGREVKNPEASPENIRNAELVADRMMKSFPAEVFKGRNREFLMKEVAFRPFEDHLLRPRLPRPTPQEYEKREEYNRRLNENWSGKINDEYLAFLNSYDWDTDIIIRKGKFGLRTALGEVILPPRFEGLNVLFIRPKKVRELKMGDRVVACKDGRYGVVIADGTGTWIIEPIYDFIGYPNDLAHVCIGGKWGVLNIRKNEYMIEPECEVVYDNNGFLFSNRIGFYKKDGLIGVIGDWGGFTAPLFEDFGGEMDSGPVKVKYKGDWGYINKENEFTADEDDAYYFYSLD